MRPTPKPRTERPRESSAGRPPGRPPDELRVFGLNACLAVFAKRPQAIRKIYLVESRLPALKAVLAWCARERIGYRIVAADDLARLVKTEHHEGVVFEVLRGPPAPLGDFLRGLDPARPALAIWLDGVGNPHNFGATLRIAAHFGADAVLLPPGSTLALSGAACRVAEGGAEHVALVALGDPVGALQQLARAGFEAVATVVREGDDLYDRPLPRRCLLVFGAEGGGIGTALRTAIPRQVRIPGSGAVESLNIATAVGVVAAEFWRQHRR
jgi:TrmH RNA methyltransferase